MKVENTSEGDELGCRVRVTQGCLTTALVAILLAGVAWLAWQDRAVRVRFHDERKSELDRGDGGYGGWGCLEMTPPRAPEAGFFPLI